MVNYAHLATRGRSTATLGCCRENEKLMSWRTARSPRRERFSQARLFCAETLKWNTASFAPLLT